MRNSPNNQVQIQVAGQAKQPAELQAVSIRGCLVTGANLQAAVGALVDLFAPNTTASPTQLEARVTHVREGGLRLEFLRLSPAGLAWVAERIDEGSGTRRG